MAKSYQIYPSIGIGRVGNADGQDDFYLGPEVPGAGPVEIDGTPVRKFKTNGKIRRQAARFRIWEFEGKSPVREITSNDAQIEWSVKLGNTKGWGYQPGDTGSRRNRGESEENLSVLPVFPSLSGVNQTVTASTPGRFLGKEVYLGELRTDSEGRLLVLGGRGLSEGPGTSLGYANNDKWYDDTSDGPITANVTIGGETFTAAPARVIISVPGYAAKILPIVSIYDRAYQVAVDQGRMVKPEKPSFKDDIYPIFSRTHNIAWTYDYRGFSSVTNDPNVLQNASEGDREDFTSDLIDQVNRIFANRSPNGKLLSKAQEYFLEKYKSGEFRKDYESDTNCIVSPQSLNLAAMADGVGGGFFPGIEISARVWKPENYDSQNAFRFKNDLPPGFFTQNLAVPWQADFNACGERWWPSQRPVTVIRDHAQTKPHASFVPRRTSNHDMTTQWTKLGFIVPGDNGVFWEVENGVQSTVNIESVEALIPDDIMTSLDALLEQDMDKLSSLKEFELSGKVKV